jgi:hypothetical protein
MVLKSIGVVVKGEEESDASVVDADDNEHRRRVGTKEAERRINNSKPCFR